MELTFLLQEKHVFCSGGLSKLALSQELIGESEDLSQSLSSKNAWGTCTENFLDS